LIDNLIDLALIDEDSEDTLREETLIDDVVRDAILELIEFIVIDDITTRALSADIMDEILCVDALAMDINDCALIDDLFELCSDFRLDINEFILLETLKDEMLFWESKDFALIEDFKRDNLKSLEILIDELRDEALFEDDREEALDEDNIELKTNGLIEYLKDSWLNEE